MLRSSILTVLFAVALFPAAKAGYWLAKAEVAQVLIKRAWINGAPDARPWPWADTQTVARLQIKQHNIDALVLGGGNDHALAFGPGLTAQKFDCRAKTVNGISTKSLSLR